MKRMGKRTLGILIGLTLGWLAQGYCSQWLNQAQAAVQGQPAIEHDAHGRQTNHPSQTYNLAGAEHLVPLTQPAPWLIGLATGIGGLFFMALVVGVPASRFADTPPRDSAHQADHPHPMVRHTPHH